MAADNGANPLDEINRTLSLLLESQKANWNEHERIWESIKLLRDRHIELLDALKTLIARIPPESLR